MPVFKTNWGLRRGWWRPHPKSRRSLGRALRKWDLSHDGVGLKKRRAAKRWRVEGRGFGPRISRRELPRRAPARPIRLTDASSRSGPLTRRGYTATSSDQGRARSCRHQPELPRLSCQLRPSPPMPFKLACERHSKFNLKFISLTRRASAGH